MLRRNFLASIMAYFAMPPFAFKIMPTQRPQGERLGSIDETPGVFYKAEEFTIDEQGRSVRELTMAWDELPEADALRMTADELRIVPPGFGRVSTSIQFDITRKRGNCQAIDRQISDDPADPWGGPMDPIGDIERTIEFFYKNMGL